MKYTFLLAIIFIVLDYSYAGQEYTIYYVFSHGIADSHKQIDRYLHNANDQKKPYLITSPFMAFDYPDASTEKERIKRKESSLAQDNEVLHFATNYFARVKPTDATVLVGLSRGASVLVNFMGIYNPSNVQAVILESPFDSIQSLVHDTLHRKKCAWVPGSKKMLLKLVGYTFKKYDVNGIKPIDTINGLRTDLPILFVCSLTDSLVPAWSTIALYEKLRSKGHKHVYLLILPHGVHSRLITDPMHGRLYQTVAHAFYRRYGLPHDPYIAQQGISRLHLCQPTPEEYAPYIPDYAKPLLSMQPAQNHQKTALTNLQA